MLKNPFIKSVMVFLLQVVKLSCGSKLLQNLSAFSIEDALNYCKNSGYFNVTNLCRNILQKTVQ